MEPHWHCLCPPACLSLSRQRKRKLASGLLFFLFCSLLSLRSLLLPGSPLNGSSLGLPPELTAPSWALDACSCPLAFLF